MDLHVRFASSISNQLMPNHKMKITLTPKIAELIHQSTDFTIKQFDIFNQKVDM